MCIHWDKLTPTGVTAETVAASILSCGFNGDLTSVEWMVMTLLYNSSEIWKLNIWWLYPEWSILRLDRMGKRENKKSNYLCFEITATILFENTLWVPSRWFLRSKQSLSQIWHLNAFLESTLSLLRATSWKGWFNKLKTSKSKNTIRQRVLNLCKLNWICKEETYFFLYQLFYK